MEAARVLCSEEYRAALKAAACRRGTELCRRPAGGGGRRCARVSGVAALLDKPNNNLAVEYCKAILELNVQMQPIALPRQGADHGQALTESSPCSFASASALRTLWAEGGAAALAPYVPETALKLYIQAEYDAESIPILPPRGAASWPCSGQPARGKAPFAASAASPRGWSTGWKTPSGSQHQPARTLLDALTTVRYPRARMRRLAMDAALGYTADRLPALPPYLHLLGARKDALPLLEETAPSAVSHSLARPAAGKRRPAPGWPPPS